jgi:hypothetical protein
MSKFKILVKPKIREWLRGTVNGFCFLAKVYDTGSIYGINNGRVSKLTVWSSEYQSTGDIINYDRGWDIEPSDDEQRELLQAILELLEAFPIRKDWRENKHYKNWRWSK